MRGMVLGLALAGLSVACATPAAAAVDETVSRALELIRTNKNAQAFDLLAPQRDERAGDPDYDYALGLAGADSGHRGDAIAAFQRVLAVQPANAQARAELARVYAMAGDIDTAKAEFDTVVNDPTVPDPVRQRVGRLVRDYGTAIAGGGNSLTGFFDAEGGYDSNINSATAATSITLPVFAFLGPATLSSAATKNDDGYYQLQAGLSGASALSRQTRLFGSLLGSWRDNFESAAFDQAALTGTGGLAHTLGNQDVLSLSGQVQRFWLGHDGYRNTVGAIGQYTSRLAGGRALSFQLQYYRLNYDNDPARDANRAAATIGYAGAEWFLNAGGGVERTVRSTARNLGYGFLAAQAGVEHPLSPKLALLAGGSIEHRNYRDTDPLFLRGRHDTQLDATLGLRAIVAKGISVRPRVTYTRAFSNIDLYDYSRFTAAIGVRAEF